MTSSSSVNGSASLAEQQQQQHPASVEKIMGRYVHAMRQLQDSLASQLITYDMHAMLIGVLLLWTVSLDFSL